MLDREGPLGCSDLASRERVTPQAISATVGSLLDKGLVVRSPDRRDARRSTVTVSAAGRDLLAGRRSAATNALAEAVGDALDPAEQRRLVECLPLLERVADRL